MIQAIVINIESNRNIEITIPHICVCFHNCIINVLRSSMDKHKLISAHSIIINRTRHHNYYRIKFFGVLGIP